MSQRHAKNGFCLRTRNLSWRVPEALDSGIPLGGKPIPNVYFVALPNLNGSIPLADVRDGWPAGPGSGS